MLPSYNSGYLHPCICQYSNISVLVLNGNMDGNVISKG